MFSRSEKTEEAFDPMATEPSGERSPMVLAALAGLLAIAGAFLLVWYLSNGDDGEVASDPNNPDAAVVAADGTVIDANKQVLVVTTAIPRGTSVRELIAAPTVYLSANAVPEQFVAASAISSVAELQELDGLILASEALPGEQLLRGRFRDPGDFDADSESLREATTGIDAPPGHHEFSFDLPVSRALGAPADLAGQRVAVVASFRLQPTAVGAVGRDVSLVVLNSVEVLNSDSTAPATGQLSTDVNQLGVAAQGTLRVTVALEPHELTDMVYAIEYGRIVLATEVRGHDETKPRAITTMRQIIGDDGAFLNEIEDGNLVDFTELFPEEGSDAEGISIEVDDYANLEELDVENPDAETVNDEEAPGDEPADS